VDPVIVVGAGQGGLSAAIHARMRGFPVGVLDQQSGPGWILPTISLPRLFSRIYFESETPFNFPAAEAIFYCSAD